MAAINANIVVDTTTLTVSPTTNNLGVTVEPINLNVYSGAFAPAGGSQGQLQYNNIGALDGVANTSVANGNITFTNLSNVKIDGGTNAYYLQTDGAGNLTWAAGGTPTGSGVPSGANTLIQLSDGSGAFDSGPGFSFDKASNIFSAPDRIIAAGNIETTGGFFVGDGGGLSNIAGGTKILNGTSNVNIPVTDGNISMSVNSTVDVVLVKASDVEINATVTAPAFTANTGVFTGDGGGLSNIAAANVVGLSLSEIANGTSNVDIATADGDVVVSVGGTSNVASFFTGGANVNGDLNVVSDITSTAGMFTGDGGGLSNIPAANVTGLSLSSIANGTSNVDIATADGNITMGVNGVADRLVVSDTGMHVSGAANINVLNVASINYPNTGQVFKTIIGNGSNGSNTHGTAYGYNAKAEGNYSTAIGSGAEVQSSEANGTAVGYNASAGGIGGVAIGYSAHGTGTTGIRNTSLGTNAGWGTTTGDSWDYGIAVGYKSAGRRRGDSTVAVGSFAGSENVDTPNNQGQADGAVAMGYRAGYDGQENYATAVGYQAGDTDQGANAVAIGKLAGYQTQAANSICINATGAALTTSTTDTFNVKPVRNAGASGLPTGFFQVAYNPTTGEFVYYS